MATKLLPVVKLATKVTVAGGALYVAWDSGLLGGSAQGSEVLGRARAAVPHALDEWMNYFGLELPAAPKLAFAPGEAWNSGVRWSVSALSMAPTRAGEYSNQGLQYLKNLTK